MSTTLGASPRSASCNSRDGLFLRCEVCGQLKRFLVRRKDGREVCTRCENEPTSEHHERQGGGPE
jgi:hypothetical protein